MTEPTPEPEPGRFDIVVDVERPHGSVQHYFHFLLGHLVPLVSAWDDFGLDPDVRRIFVRSCAVLDPLLLEFELPKLAIVPREQHSQLLRDAAAGGLRAVALAARDDADLFDREVFAAAQRRIFERLGASIDAHAAALRRMLPATWPRIVFIDRAPPDAFYGSADAEIRTAGAQRRSIANVGEAHAALEAQFGQVLFTTLEGRSLAYQIALFHLADIVVCQHGAALANLVWSRPGASVVEIMPRHATRASRNRGFWAFERLAGRLGVNYR
ncbi:MAG TPA: glycosyltransferase family 61 protein, partial [Caulobacteraceae bacterium]